MAFSGVLATNSADPLDIRTGVLYSGNQTLVAATSGLSVTVSPLHFVGSKAYNNGAYVGCNQSVATVAVPAAPSLGLKRIDVLYAVQQDANALVSADGTTTAVFGVHPGVASSSPSKPALTDAPAAPVGAVEVGTITWDSTSSVPTATNASVAGGSCTLATTCQWTALRGNPLPMRNSTEQGSLSAYDGLRTYRLDLHSMQAYNAADSAWYPRSGTNIAGAGWADNTGTPFNGTSYRRTADGMCQLSGLIYRTDPTYTTTSGQFYVIGFVPAWMAPTDCAKQYPVWTSLGVAGSVVRVTTAGQVSFAIIGSSVSVVSGTFSVAVDGFWWR
jgi:hypothetical protein